jgi:hypothetical protein
MTQQKLELPEGALCSVQPAGRGGAGAGGRVGRSDIMRGVEAPKSRRSASGSLKVREDAKFVVAQRKSDRRQGS